MRKICALIAGLVAVAAFSAAAQARTVEFVSQHPVPHKFGGGFCYIDVPHVHNYGPEDPRMYREANGQHYFVGDPAPFAYDGPRYSYYGAHPVAEADQDHRRIERGRGEGTHGQPVRRSPAVQDSGDGDAGSEAPAGAPEFGTGDAHLA